jgi:hypothetical protein
MVQMLTLNWRRQTEYQSRQRYNDWNEDIVHGRRNMERQNHRRRDLRLSRRRRNVWWSFGLWRRVFLKVLTNPKKQQVCSSKTLGSEHVDTRYYTTTIHTWGFSTSNDKPATWRRILRKEKKQGADSLLVLTFSHSLTLIGQLPRPSSNLGLHNIQTAGRLQPTLGFPLVLTWNFVLKFKQQR